VKWQSCQSGPSLYDNDGELIYSGACQFRNRIVFDFKISEYKGERLLSGAIQNADFPEGEHDVGAAWFMGPDYEVKHSVLVERDVGNFDLHEFNVFDKGRRAILVHTGGIDFSGESLGIKGKIRIKDNGFKEIDTDTGKTLFKWRAYDHIPLNESTFHANRKARKEGRDTIWDAYHINSVDKNSDGDYLVSHRHLDCLTLISGKDGKPIWRAGGKKNDFEMIDGLVWSRQHHARIQSHTRDQTVITLMDNAMGGEHSGKEPTHDFSRALLIELNHPNNKPTTARMLKHYDRPDGDWNVKRGSVQILPNKNVFVGWTDAGYISEFTDDGQVLMEAQFLKTKPERFGTYRAYKFDGWVGKPKDKPVVKAITAVAKDVSTTTIYVSWNGATEIKYWDFYADEELIGTANKTSFETSFVAEGALKNIHVDAVAKDGEVLGTSLKTEPVDPSELLLPESLLGEHPDPEAHDWNLPALERYKNNDSSFPWLTASVVVNVVVLVGLVIFCTRAGFRMAMRIHKTRSEAAGYKEVPLNEM
jgi:hypothetical protein